MLTADTLADNGLRLLRLGDMPGDSAARDAGLYLCYAALTLEPDGSRQGSLALACSYTLRSRFRWTLDPTDLITANILVERALVATIDPSERSHLLAERARVLVRLKQAEEMMQPAEDTSSSTHVTPRTQPVSVALESVERAIAYGTDVAGEDRSDLHHARGLALLAIGQEDKAIESLREAILLRPSQTEYLYDLARVLAESERSGDVSEASQILIEIANQEMTRRPREAFEAARFHGHWATERQEWQEAAEAYDRALRARTHARDREANDQRQLRWLYETGSVAARGAYAWTRARQPNLAIRAIEDSQALELAERLQAQPVEPGRLLAQDDCFVYINLTDKGSDALIVRPAASETVAVELPAMDSNQVHERVLEYAYRYRTWQSTQSPGDRKAWMRYLESLLRWLGAALMAPLLESTPTTGLTLVPGGPLSLLPIHAAVIDNNYAIEAHRFRYVPSARALAIALGRLESHHHDTPMNGLVVSNPTSAFLQPLANADIEASVVRSWLGEGISLHGDDATLPAVEEAMPGHSVAHFAAHAGARFDEPLLSAVMLAGDEPLTLGKLLEFRVALKRNRLTVLSACESAMQDVRVPEEQLGLPFGFLQAGALGVIGSLWAVNDASTMVLMARFYEEWVGAGKPPREALTDAQRWMLAATGEEIADWLDQLTIRVRSNENAFAAAIRDLRDRLRMAPNLKPYQHPYHWAAFAHYGV